MNLWGHRFSHNPNQKFCPGSLLEGKAEISVTFGWDFGRNNGLMNSFWIKLTFRGRYWILILFSKPSFKFQKCLYTCKAAAVAQSSLVGCKIFRPSWDVKLVLLGPRHPFFSDPFFSFFSSTTLEHLSVLFRFLCQNNREPAFVCKCDTHYPLGQWNVSVDSSKTLDRDGHSWNWIFHHMCILTCTCRQHS